jgi:hypothetical protein
MAEILLVVLVILWVLGYLQIPGVTVPNATLFAFNGHPITLINLIIFLMIVWIIGLLHSPARKIASVLLVIWVLSLFGILAIPGLANIVFLVLVLGIFASFFGKKHN